MMMKKLVTLGLGVMLSANLLSPVMASDTVQVTDTNHPRLVVFDKTFEEGKMPDHVYEQLKGKMANFKSGKMIERKTMTKEEHLAKLQDYLESIEAKYADGNIDQDKYDSMKEKLLKTIEAVENGEIPEYGMKKGFIGDREPLSKEEMLEKLNEKLTKLNEANSEGKLDDEKYEQIKEHVTTMIEKVENGEEINFVNHGKKGHYKGKKGFALMNLTKEEKIEKLQEKMSRLDELLNEGKIDQEKYETAKDHTESMIEKIQNDEEGTVIKEFIGKVKHF